MLWSECTHVIAGSLGLVWPTPNSESGNLCESDCFIELKWNFLCQIKIIVELETLSSDI